MDAKRMAEWVAQSSGWHSGIIPKGSQG